MFGRHQRLEGGQMAGERADQPCILALDNAIDRQLVMVLLQHLFAFGALQHRLDMGHAETLPGAVDRA